MELMKGDNIEGSDHTPMRNPHILLLILNIKRKIECSKIAPGWNNIKARNNRDKVEGNKLGW